MADYSRISIIGFDDILSSPSGIPDYFHNFHKPLVERALLRNGGNPINLLDVACGYCHELEFLIDNEDVRLFGLDISEEILRNLKIMGLTNTHLIASDVSKGSPIKEESVDAVIAVNAMAYVPEHMLKVIYDSLKKGGEAVVNFYDFDKNRSFFKYHKRHGANISNDNLVIDDQSFSLKILDLSEYDDEMIRKLGRQLFFQGRGDIESLIKIIGFEIGDHLAFNYSSTANSNNETDVYLLRK